MARRRGFFSCRRRAWARGKHAGAARRCWRRADALPAGCADRTDRRRTATAATIRPEKPGFLHELGHWWDGSIGYLHDKIKAAPGTFEDIGKKSGDAAKGAAVATQEGMKKTLDVSKDAAVVIGRLPNTRVVDVHERCAIAGNGAPDCAAAATIACRAKGFSGGKPLDSRTGEACPDTKLASGKPRRQAGANVRSKPSSSAPSVSNLSGSNLSDTHL